MADDDGQPAESGNLGERVDRLEDGQNRIVSKLDQLLGIRSGKSGSMDDDGAERPGGRPASIEEQVRAELQRADDERAKQAGAEAEKSEREQIKEQLAKLTEVKPAQPQPRRQRLMWGNR